jgi:aminoglycoside phosphotransferase (APT) family kinase protein
LTVDVQSAQEILTSHGVVEVIERCGPLRQGYSSDLKYILWADGQPRFLLRLSRIELLARRESEFNALAVHHGRGILCPRPIAFGQTLDRTHCFTLLEYLPGDCAEDVLPELDRRTQYQIGTTAGAELRRLHQIEGDEPSEAWFARRLKKYRLRLQQAREVQLGFPGQREVEEYVEAHVSVLENSPVRFQHDDFHPGNVILRDGRYAGIIDFNRCDWGDPVEDFYKVPWFTAPVSKAFAQGQIEAYLEQGEVPDFWLRYNLLVAMNLHGSLVWERQHSSSERQSVWLDHVVEMVESHDLQTSGPPAWLSRD